ncbi:MAG: rod shape-determining protein RodA [Anaerolineales bacterium]|nr:rod shape-determining protein RodA [Anaerolineales bacterium]
MDRPSINWRYFDFFLLGAVAILAIFGIAMIRSAIAGNIELLELNLVGRQIIFLVGGIIVIFITTAIDYHLWSAISKPMYFGMAALLGVLFIVGAAVFGSARWFDTGVILIQPSELAKIVIILVLADFFTLNQLRIYDIRTIARSLLWTGGIVIWILLQPNLSTSIVIFVIWFALLWASGVQIKHLIVFAGAIILISLVSYPFLVDYQQQRILNFLFPNPDAPHGELYNIRQALITIGSGGWFGKGYGLGSQTQLRFLKVRHTDFIFSAMAEEFGFIGITVVLSLLALVIYRVLRAARLARDTFGALICYGVATMIAFQAIVNIGVNLNMLPATGLTLPFVSYGGSSLLSLLLGIGLVESVIVRHKSLEF